MPQYAWLEADEESLSFKLDEKSIMMHHPHHDLGTRASCADQEVNGSGTLLVESVESCGKVLHPCEDIEPSVRTLHPGEDIESSVKSWPPQDWEFLQRLYESCQKVLHTGEDIESTIKPLPPQHWELLQRSVESCQKVLHSCENSESSVKSLPPQDLEFLQRSVESCGKTLHTGEDSESSVKTMNAKSVMMHHPRHDLGTRASCADQEANGSGTFLLDSAES